ncbi:IS200/IS605 family transposase, partial [Streptosporangium sp. NPDC005286]|uniref:IS200/IS605 family transposase n=1 Tax=Streptosporangium sp. NPDC005286 TaxID=3154463 RepID=UPI0033AE0BEA
MSPRWEPDFDIRRGRTVVHPLHTHLVLTPRYRCGVFTDELLCRCEDIMIEVCDSLGARLVEFNGEHDQVHLLVCHPPKVALSTLVNSLKGVSARLLRKEYPAHIRKYLWGGR